jgi:hypothetical protein
MTGSLGLSEGGEYFDHFAFSAWIPLVVIQLMEVLGERCSQFREVDSLPNELANRRNRPGLISKPLRVARWS